MAAALDIAAFLLPVIGLLTAGALIVAGAFAAAAYIIERLGGPAGAGSSTRR